MQKRSLFSLLLICLCAICMAQTTSSVAVSPNIDKTDPTNGKIIAALENFIQLKDNPADPELLKYCYKADFEKFGAPFFYFRNIEKNGSGALFYTPSIMEIIPTAQNTYLVKVAFISKDPTSPFVKAVANLIANHQNGEVKFSSFLNNAVDKWKKIQVGEMTYFLSPNRSGNIDQNIKKQQAFNHKLALYFNCTNLPFNYFSASSVEEFFNMQGFQYHPMMYQDSTGGVIMGTNILSGSNSEYYPHEISHLYIRKSVPGIDQYFDEGLATYLGGSGNSTYQELKETFKPYLDESNLWVIMQQGIFDQRSWKKDLPTSYLVSAMVCEYGIQSLGKERFLDLLKNGAARDEVFRQLNLSSESVKATLSKLL